jgi:hypothetical protein
MSPIRAAVPSVVVALIGNGVWDRLVAAKTRRSEQKAQAARQDVRNLQEALRDFRLACWEVVSHGRRHDLKALARVRVEYDLALNRVLNDEVVKQGRGYADIAELYAAGDVDTSNRDERLAFEGFSDLLRKTMGDGAP